MHTCVHPTADHKSEPALNNRRQFLLKLAQALMTFGAPSHGIEAQLTAVGQILEVKGEYIHLPGVIIYNIPHTYAHHRTQDTSTASHATAQANTQLLPVDIVAGADATFSGEHRGQQDRTAHT